MQQGALFARGVIGPGRYVPLADIGKALARLPRVSFHALRHNPWVGADHTGVKHIPAASATARIYGHLIRGGDEVSARVIEGVLK